jgi:hypothetical protein
MANEKKVKLQPKSVARVNERGGYAIVPELRISGRWLEALGFQPGDYVSIAEGRGRITISICKEKQAPASTEKATRPKKAARSLDPSPEWQFQYSTNANTPAIDLENIEDEIRKLDEKIAGLRADRQVNMAAEPGTFQFNKKRAGQ